MSLLSRLTVVVALCSTLHAEPRALSFFAAVTARNAAADGIGMAPGSFVTVGAIGILSFDVPTTTFRLTTSDGVTATIPVIVPPSIVSGSGSTLLWMLLPAKAPLGTAHLEVTTHGASYTTDFEIVAYAPALFSKDYGGLGPALALNQPGAVNALTSAAVPNGEVALFATGLGDIRTGEVTVDVAGDVVSAIFAGPQVQFPGLDQINFRLPVKPNLGCYVPVVVRARGVATNVVTISINSDRFACAHPLGLSYDDLLRLDAGGRISLAYFTISGNYTLPIRPSEGAAFGFYNADATGTAYLAGVQLPDEHYFTCAPLQSPSSVAGPGQGVDAGDMTIAGPVSTLTLKASLYSQPFPSLVPVFGPGSWQVSAPGGPDVFGFTLPFRLPPLFMAATGKLDNEGLLVTWNPAGYITSDTVTIYLSSLARPGTIACNARASEGRLRVPATIINSLQPLRKDLNLMLHLSPPSRPHFSLPRRSGPPIPGVLDYQFSLNYVDGIQ